jgi:hypothetical protein
LNFLAHAKNADEKIDFRKEVNKMPRGDRTGPWGTGPMTGRSMGYCAGFSGPGFMSPGPGFGFGRGVGFGRGMGLGFGRGMGFGRGRGWRQAGFGRSFGYPYTPGMPYGYPQGMSYSPPFQPFTKEDEEAIHEDQVKILEDQLSQIKKRLGELKKQDKEKK